MIRIALVHVGAALLLALVACGGKSSSFTGTWVLDTESALSPEQRREMESNPQLKESFEKMKAAFSMEIEIRSDGTVRGNLEGLGQGAGPASGEGRWEEKDGVVTIRGDKGSALELRLRDGKLVGTVPGRGREVVFRRK